MRRISVHEDTRKKLEVIRLQYKKRYGTRLSFPSAIAMFCRAHDIFIDREMVLDNYEHMKARGKKVRNVMYIYDRDYDTLTRYREDFCLERIKRDAVLNTLISSGLRYIYGMRTI